MTRDELMNGIQLPPEAQEIVKHTPIPAEEFVRMKNLFLQDFPEFLRQAERKENSPQWLLCFYVTMGPECFPRFQEKGVSKDIFFATLKDITIWTRTGLRRHGRYGLCQPQWVAKGLRMELFRLGRLQFEPVRQEDGTPVLNVHIPEDGPLKPEEVTASFQQARDFFASSPEPYSRFVCESWLLFPALGQLLPPDSNILQFQKLFQLRETDCRSRQAEERIFGFVSDSPADYPVHTSLQKQARAYLMTGKPLGTGLGYRPFCP